MVGKVSVVVENAYIKYEFTINRNITVIRGESGTGKTNLVNMINAYNEDEDSGIRIRSDKSLVVISGKDWKDKLSRISDSVVFIDEQSRFMKSEEFAEAVKGSDNYYVLITREKLSNLPYSITEIYGIRTSGKYAGLTGEYTANEFYRIYGERPADSFKPDTIITEDSNSGYDFWNSLSDKITCVSAGGKDRIITKLKEIAISGDKYLAIVDGAAFGPEIEEILKYIRYDNSNVEIYAPESFEYLILTSGIFKSNEVQDKCLNTSDYADSAKYMSWENFYTDLLSEITKDTEMQYSKRKLNLYYLSDRSINRILGNVPDKLVLKAEN